MTTKEVKKKIEEKFGDKVQIQQGSSEKQYFVLVNDKSDIKDVVRYVFKDLGARMNIVTGIDQRDHIELIYHFSFDKFGFIFHIKALVEKPFPAIDSITEVVPGAKWIEREIYELYDIKFKGHPELIPLLRSDNRPADYFPFQREVKETHPTIRMKEKEMKEK